MIPLKSQSRVREIFNACLQSESHEQRYAVLDRECGGDAEVRDSVLQLLEAYDASHSFLEQPLDHFGSQDHSQDPSSTMNSTALHAPDLAQLPSVGNYKLLELLGEGGMGVVYVAQQERPIRRLVAVKLIKPGMDSNQVIARFESERQALAVMNHPNIAKVLDAGTSSSGRPYFVMELVRGKPITEYCDHHHLGLRERLELFANVCDAVHHAHQKGIIHRDLKPSNILVELDDVRTIPKIIDFGVAKSLYQPPDNTELVTGLSQMIGTPLYMSPEQAQLNSFDVDTRSDVYSLGVVLYELLTGHLPFDRETLQKVGLDEFRRVICEDEPPRPSTCVSTLNNKRASTVSESRQKDSRHFSLVLKRELDWIVMQSLEKDRNRRYQSAHDFSDDIRRFLKDERVLACPPTWHYRMGKWAKRHTMLLISATLALVSLIGGAGVSVWYSIKANQSLVIASTAEQLASQRLDQVLTAQAEINSQSKLAERAASVIFSRDINQVEQLMHQLLVEQEEFLGKNAPAVISTINRLGFLCDEQGRLAEGEAYYRRAIERCKESEIVEPDSVLEIMQNLAGNLNEQDRYQEAEVVWREVAERFRDRYGSQHSKTVNADIYLGITLTNQFRYEEAIAKFNELLNQEPEGSPGAQALRWSIARSQENLHKPLDRLYYETGVGAFRNNKLSLAFTNFRKAMQEYPKNPLYWYTTALAAICGGNTNFFLQHCETLLQDNWQFQDPSHAYWTVKSLVLHPESTDDWDLLIAKASPLLNSSSSDPVWKATLGAAMCRGKKFLEASAHLKTIVEQDDSGIGRLWLAVSLWNLGDRKSAREELIRAERQLAIFHIDAPWYLREGDSFLVREVRSELGVEILPGGERLAEAEPLVRETLEISREARPAGHPHIATSLDNLATLHWKQGKLDQSVPMFEELLKTREAALGRTHVDTLITVANLGVNYKDAGRIAEAIPLLEEAYEASKREPSIAWVGQPLLDAYSKAADPTNPDSIARVTTLMREMLAVARASLPNDSPQLARQLAVVSKTLLTLKVWDEAEPLIREALTIREKVEPDAWTIFNTKSLLGGTLLGQKKYAEAEPLLLAGYEGLKKKEASIPPQGTTRIPESLERLVQLYTGWHAAEPDQGYDAKAAEWQQKLDEHNAVLATEKPASAPDK